MLPLIMRREDARRLVAAFAAYCALAAFWFRSLVAHPATMLPHDLGDPVLSTWILWWNAHQVPLTRAWWDGLSFYPGHGALALSDHRLGLGLIATPLQWLGGSPVLAHNTAFLLSFPLCAIAAHALAWSLTRNHAAAYIAGLVFGFNPYRIAHLEHLELLSVYWLPIVLLAAHRFIACRSTGWLAAFGFAWLMQALCSSYYLLYAAPLLGLWIWWFAGADDRGRRAGALIAALAIASLGLIPIAVGFWRIQHALGLGRTIREIEQFSADIASIFWASPLLALWHGTGSGGQERQIFPGLVVLALVVGGTLANRRRDRSAPRLRAVTVVFAVAGSVFAIAALVAGAHPWSVSVGGLTIAANSPTKPATEALVLFAAAAISTRAFSAAYRARSTFAFYSLAALLMWACALGPHPTLFGRPALYRGPYAALMWLPGYDTGLRAPARFAMIGILSLSVAAGLAAHRIAALASGAKRRAFFAVCIAGIVADGAVRTVPIFPAPLLETLPVAARSATAVLELPLGDPVRDIAAVMRTIGYGRPVVNGYSGYLPPHYRTFQTALDRGDTSALDSLSSFGPIAVGVSRDQTARPLALSISKVSTIGAGSTPLHEWFVVAPTIGTGLQAGVERCAIRRVIATPGSTDVTPLAQGGSRWVSPSAQQGNEAFDIELDERRDVSEVLVGTGREVECWPRAIAITTSIDGQTWTDAWRGSAGGAAFLATLENPRAPLLRFAFRERLARFVKIQQTARDESYPWIVTTFAVLGR